MLDRVNTQVLRFKKSGIRKFAEAASQIPGVVSLTIGEPEFNTSDRIKNAAKQALDDNHTHYASGQGLLSLRQTVASFENKQNAMNYKPEEVIITNGSTEGLAACFLSLLNEGDEVIIPQPMYVTYQPMIEYCKAKLVPLDISSSDFQIVEAALRASITPRTKMLVITSPNNPTGVVLNRQSLDAIKSIALEHRLFVISDDVYHQLVYLDRFDKLSDDVEMRHLLIVAQSFSKPYAMTGWRIGYLLADAPIAAHINLIHSYLVTGISTFTQVATIDALREDTSYVRELYRQRLMRSMKVLDDLEIDYVKPEGAFYIFIKIGEFGMGSEAFCTKALHDYKLALVPGIYFNPSKDEFIRISYAVKETDLYEGLNRLGVMVKDLRNEKNS